MSSCSNNISNSTKRKHENDDPTLSISTTPNINAVLKDQWAMAASFYGNPITRTPILIIWVASFGGALHAAVTVYYYIEVGASDMDIGRIGFFLSLGSLIFAPFAGYALDRGMPVFGPIMATAIACSLGCLIRGLATSVRGLYIGAAILSVGVNLWTVVLLHIAHCTAREHRSHVLSGYKVQETGLRLLGKALFPIWDLMVRYVLRFAPEGLRTTLFRYRVHMATCTSFCLFGTVALLVERRALQQQSALDNQNSANDSEMSTMQLSKALEVHPATPDSAYHHSSETLPPPASPPGVDILGSPIPWHPPSSNNHVRYMIIIGALLIQSWCSTVLSVLWPLVLRDQFHFAATEYGLVSVVASIVSTSTIASFPSLEHHVGRIRTAARAAMLASVSCFLAFVVLPNLLNYHHDKKTAAVAADVEDGTNPDAVIPEDDAATNLVEDNSRSLLSRLVPQSFMVHAVLAIAFQACVHMLEPSLKSMLSLAVPKSAQNRSLGFMSTLGGVGAMSGNLMGTWLFGLSKGGGRFHYFWLGNNGALPFAVVAGLLAIAALFLWALEGDDHAIRQHHHHQQSTSKNACSNKICEEGSAGNFEGHGHLASVGQVETESPEKGHNEGMFFPLLHLETSYEMKLD